MSVMPIIPNMHGKWDNVITAPQLPFKMDRPAYSTPPPVENTPSNNECHMVELRGSKVASFSLGCEEYICLPQVFDLFLKHLVGGLHTVYTKLKRLNITPVVCNVEQVRILRGLGAIQPGVNRCKLITRKDFEILYQDCTTASRPGRPPKRYPVLPPTTDLMSHHASMRGNNSLLSQTELATFHKRMRLGHNLEQNNERRASGSPVKEHEKTLSNIPGLSAELHNSSNANLAYFQAIRQQYQQAAVSGLHNGLDPQQINPALAPFMMMSHPAIFSSAIPPTSMAMLNHINQIAGVSAGAMTSAAVAAAAQLAAGGGSLHSGATPSLELGRRASQSPNNDKDSDADEAHTPRSYNNALGMSNGIGSDGCASPASSLGSIHGSGIGRFSEGDHALENSFKDSMASKVNHDDLSNAVDEHTKVLKVAPSSDDEMKPVESVSSMQTLLTNIQGLLKVAADNASLQEKHASIAIAELKLKLTHEKQQRHNAERKLSDCQKEKVEAEKRFSRERKENKRLQGKITSMQQLLGHDINNNADPDDTCVASPQRSLSPPNGTNPSDALSESSTPPASVSSPLTSFSATTSFDAAIFSARIAAASQQAGNLTSSPSPTLTNQSVASVSSNLNNSNNHLSDDGKSPDYARRSLLSDQQHLFFKGPPLLYQPAASQ